MAATAVLPPVLLLASLSLLPFGDKTQCYTIIAPALSGGRWAIVKDVPVVPAAAYTMVLNAWPDQFKIPFGSKHLGDGRKKARPAGAAIKFHG